MIKANKQFLLSLVAFASIFLSREVVASPAEIELSTACPELPEYPPDFDPNLKAINRKHESLTSIPCSIFLHTNLTNLYLHDNEITHFSTEIGLLTNLKDLSLYQNQLTQVFLPRLGS